MYLSEFINVKRRYTRSINLERDIDISDSVLGYIPTNKPLETLGRFIESFKCNSIRRWTITGVYGTGKSSFAHFLAALCASNSNPIKQNALKILNEQKNIDKSLIKGFERNILKEGLVRAVVTASREPISYTIIKALYIGLNLYSFENSKIKDPLVDNLLTQIKNNENINDDHVIEAVKQVATYSPNGLLLIIDELGKNLEYSTNNQLNSDLYLLQQIAELPSDEKNPKIFMFGILHQAFSEYTYGINLAQKNEWMKIQGRFEDIPFIEAPEQVVKLIGSSINVEINFFDKNKKRVIEKWAKEWKNSLKDLTCIKNLDVETIESIYPLHPMTASILPILSSKYAQNDRTIFTFLSSQEPYSFNSLIKGLNFDDKNLPTIRLYDLYDYFVETAGVLISSRPNFQRWNEIQSRINDAKNLDIDKLNLLKTIGILNLISSGGPLRATKATVVNSMCNSYESSDKSKWDSLISDLEKEKFVTIRNQLDEIRIWEGSDFNIESGITSQIEKTSEQLDWLLNKYYPLAPIIAQKHSYKTGTLRYFERVFCNDESLLSSIDCMDKFSDGLIIYWCGEDNPSLIPPSETKTKKPLILLKAKNIKNLKDNCLELVALLRLKQQSSELQIDAIARKEILQRINIAQKILEESIQQAYSLIDNDCFVNGKNFKNIYSLNAILSIECERIYKKTPILWNELINKRELTSQGSMARKSLMNAMLTNYKEAKLGIVGNGPEYCIYESLLRNTGIHTKLNGAWLFDKPKKDENMIEIWKEIENYCLDAVVDSRSITDLYEILDLPPYGIKRGLVPILFLAVYIVNMDKISIYFENKFIPKFSCENIELLLKKPEKFSIKNTQPNTVQSKVINELYEKLFNAKSDTINTASLLSTAKALVRLINELPDYSKNTRRISKNAIAVRNNITTMTEPDKILFEDLPKSLGYAKFTTKKVTEEQINLYCQDLITALKNINHAYEDLLMDCRKEIITHFKVQSNDLRKELVKRSSSIKQKTIEPCLKRFINAIEEKSKNDTQWLEAVIMVIADKPADSWTDIDQDKFKIQVEDTARRFLNLESIYREITDVFGNNINAKKINCTDSDGNEINKILWIDNSEKKSAEELCNKFMKDNNLDSNPKLKEAIIATLIDNILNESITKENAGKSNG